MAVIFYEFTGTITHRFFLPIKMCVVSKVFDKIFSSHPMWVCYTSSCLFHTVAVINHQLVGDIFWGWLNHYLTIIIILPLARKGSESIAHLTFGLTAELLILLMAYLGERDNNNNNNYYISKF